MILHCRAHTGSLLMDLAGSTKGHFSGGLSPRKAIVNPHELHREVTWNFMQQEACLAHTLQRNTWGQRGTQAKEHWAPLRKYTAAAWPQICASIPRHLSSPSHRKEAEDLWEIMASCVRHRELLCLSSPYTHCQNRWPCITYGLAMQSCPMSASQDWAILRLRELTLTLSSLSHSSLATYIVCSTRDSTITASVQREGNKCLSGPESSSPERQTSYI